MQADSPDFRIRADVRYRQVAGEGIVLRQKAGEVLVLNGVGARVLALLDEGLARSEIVERLALEFDAEPERIGADVATFLMELRAAEVVRAVPES